MSFFSLHNHVDQGSNLRLIDTVNKPEDLCQKAFDLGLLGIACTDHASLSAHLRFENYVSKKRAEKDSSGKVTEQALRWQQFKYILGDEIYLCRNGLNSENYDTKKDKFYHFILLALDQEGHHQLRQLSTISYKQSFMRSNMRRVPTYYRDIKEIIGKNKGHIIGTSACMGSWIDQKILAASSLRGEELKQLEIEIETWLKYIQDIFGVENFYLELQPSMMAEQRYVNKELIKLGQKYNIKCIITTDSHYLQQSDQRVHRAFLNSKDGDREVDEFYASAYLMNEEQIHSYMDNNIGVNVVNTCLNNTIEIGKRVQDYSLKKPFKLPFMPDNKRMLECLPVWCRDINEFKLFFNSSEEADRIFIRRLIEKIETDSEFKTKESLDKIIYELNTIWESSVKQKIVWSKYFCQVADYINIAWEEGDSILSPGRGSSVGFYINYLMEITQINPLKEDVPTFSWRYINPERASILDCDSDVQSNRRDTVINALKDKYGTDKVIKVATFKTEKSKSAILTAARGLNIDNDEAQYLASMIESDRGQLRTLKQTAYGDKENNLPPNNIFKNEMENNYPELWEIAQQIEGLVTGCGVHAGGVIIVDEVFTERSSIIKVNSGESVSAYDLHMEEDLGHVKIDLLATDNLTRMRACLDLLLKDERISWQGSLRATYEKYLGVYNLERKSPEMWQMVSDNKIVSLFQFETAVGSQAIALAKPNNIAELSSLNSIMRLMSEEKGSEQPLNKFARFKNNPSLWDQEMIDYELKENERQMLHKYLDYEYGICAAQEDIMSILQDPLIGNFSLAWVDGLRKSIAKKKPEDFEKAQIEFFKIVEEKGISPAFANYVWNVLVRTQRGYGFPNAHALAYSLLGLQNMNLAYRFPLVYWNTANLIVDADGQDLIFENKVIDEDDATDTEDAEDIIQCQTSFNIEDDVYLDDIGTEEFDSVVPEVKKKAASTVDYGRVSSAIGKFMARGIQVNPPNINRSSYTFVPDADTNSIMYGLRGITRIPGKLIKTIISGRPYNSIADFTERIKVNKLQMLNLIKSGAFDELNNGAREEAMNTYLRSIADTKKDLNLRNMQMLIEYNLISDEMNFGVELFRFNKKLKSQKEGIFYLIFEDDQFYFDNFDIDLLVDGNKINQKTWDKMYSKGMDPMRAYIKQNKSKLLLDLNNALIQELRNKYAVGTISKWEMESLGFYYHEHELIAVDDWKYGFADFTQLSPEPVVEKSFMSGKGHKITIFKLYKIIGTVLDRDKLHNTITILTRSGVVTVKTYKQKFVEYDRQISERGSDGHKKIKEKSWFSRGNILQFVGIRRGSEFIVKTYKQTHEPAIAKVISISENGTLTLQSSREEVI